MCSDPTSTMVHGRTDSGELSLRAYRKLDQRRQASGARRAAADADHECLECFSLCLLLTDIILSYTEDGFSELVINLPLLNDDSDSAYD